LSTLKLTRPVGSAFEYSNVNCNLLGLIIESASGESYTDYIQDHVFTTLGMSHSYTSQGMARPNGLTVGHRYWFAQPFAAPNLPVPRGSLASGQLFSRSEDKGRYPIAQLNEGRYGNLQIISPAGIVEMQRPAAEANTMGGSMGQYGMGSFVQENGETKMVWHYGTVPDFFSYMSILPEQKRGLVLLVNANHLVMNMALTEFGMGVAALVAGQQPVPRRLDFIPWALRSLLLVPALQMAGVAATMRLLRQWRRGPGGRPSRGRMWGLHILLPAVPNLFLVAIPVFLRIRRLLRFMLLFMPDLSWVALICGGFAGVWTFLRTGLILRTLRRP
jgi:CubicO group peptidase (beta-lactamase class C family)